MLPFKFSEKIKVMITPNQIHKISDRLRDEMYQIHNRGSNNLDTYTVSKAQASTSSVEEIVEILENKFVERFKYQKISYEYANDLTVLKEALFKFNVESDVSEKLSKIQALKSLKNYCEIFRECVSCSDDKVATVNKAVDYFKNIEDSSNSLELSIMFYNHKDAKKLIKSSNKEILNLEKEITIINANGEIGVELFESTVDVLGLG